MANSLVTGEEAAAHGLPPISISFHAGEAGWMVVKFPAAGVYLALSGPPGGPLFFVVRHLAPGETLRDAARIDERRPMQFGGNDTLVFNGIEREAVLFFVGESHAATVGCATRIDVGNDSLAVLFGVGGRPGSLKRVQEVAEHQAFRSILATFRAEAGAAPSTSPDAPPRESRAETETETEEEIEEEEIEQEVEQVERSTPAPEAAGTTPARLLRAMSTIQETMATMGVWSEEVPDAATYARWNLFEAQMYSFQYTLCAMEEQVRRSAEMDPEIAVGAATSISDSLVSMLDSFGGSPQADAFVAVAKGALKG